MRSFIEKLCLNALFANKSEETKVAPIEITEAIILSRLSKPSFQNDSLTIEHFRPFANGDKLEDYLKKIEIYLLKNALDNHNNNQTHAAKQLGISRTGLIKKLKRITH